MLYLTDIILENFCLFLFFFHIQSNSFSHGDEVSKVLSCKFRREDIKSNWLVSHPFQLFADGKISNFCFVHSFFTYGFLLCAEWTWTGPWLLAFAKEIKAPLIRIFAYWNDIIGCPDAADLMLLLQSQSPKSFCQWLTQSELQKAFNAKKDFKYPKATENNLYNPQIIFAEFKLPF